MMNIIHRINDKQDLLTEAVLRGNLYYIHNSTTLNSNVSIVHGFETNTKNVLMFYEVWASSKTYLQKVSMTGGYIYPPVNTFIPFIANEVLNIPAQTVVKQFSQGAGSGVTQFVDIRGTAGGTDEPADIRSNYPLYFAKNSRHYYAIRSLDTNNSITFKYYWIEFD